MVIHLNKNIADSKAKELAEAAKCIHFFDGTQHVLVSSSKLRELPAALSEFTSGFFPTSSDIQLASKEYLKERRTITIGNQQIGGNTNNTIVITGPCSVESKEQIEVSKFYEKLPKPHALAVQEWLDGKIYYKE